MSFIKSNIDMETWRMNSSTVFEWILRFFFTSGFLKSCSVIQWDLNGEFKKLIINMTFKVFRGFVSTELYLMLWFWEGEQLVGYKREFWEGFEMKIGGIKNWICNRRRNYLVIWLISINLKNLMKVFALVLKHNSKRTFCDLSVQYMIWFYMKRFFS